MVENLVGQKFGKLTVIKRVENDKFNKAQWLCTCECGGSVVTNTSRLKQGLTTSCGCMKGNRGQKVIPIHVGDKFGKLTIIEQGGSDKFSNKIWKCACECGSIVEVTAHNLRKGRTTSCGCIKRVSDEHKKLYQVWKGMRARCYSPYHPSYQWYGERGIKVCEEWKNNFVSFKQWALANGFQMNLTIERIDFNGNYEPSNCKWIERSEQSSNTRRTIKIEYNGQTHHLKQWAKILGINYETLRSRIRDLGWSVERAFTTP